MNDNNPNTQIIERKIWNMIDLIIKPEKCSVCGEWMPAMLTISNNYKHECIERKCKCNKTKETN